MQAREVIQRQLSRPVQLLAGLSCVLIAVAFAKPGSVDGSRDILYAEHMPLATHSLLLDITRAGDTLVAVGERGHVMLSTDGDHWKQADVVPTRSTLTTVFSLGQRLWAGGHDAAIITSGDGGNTWTRQFFDPGREQAVMDILFTDENHGVAIGSYGLYLETSDGGKTWKDGTVDAENQYHLNAMVRFADGRRMIAGEAGYSYRSYDDGKSWERVLLPYQGSMWGALKTDTGCVLFFGLIGHVLKSCDFGSTWSQLDTGSTASISGAVAADGKVVLAANGGTILVLQDGAFKTYRHSSGVDFSAVISLGNGKFLLTGEHGTYHFREKKASGDGND